MKSKAYYVKHTSIKKKSTNKRKATLKTFQISALERFVKECRKENEHIKRQEINVKAQGSKNNYRSKNPCLTIYTVYEREFWLNDQYLKVGKAKSHMSLYLIIAANVS